MPSRRKGVCTWPCTEWGVKKINMGTEYNKSTDLLQSLWQKRVPRSASMQSSNNYAFSTNCIHSPCSIRVRERATQNSPSVVLQSELSQEEAAILPQQISALTCGTNLPALKIQESGPRLIWNCGVLGISERIRPLSDGQSLSQSSEGQGSSSYSASKLHKFYPLWNFTSFSLKVRKPTLGMSAAFSNKH